MNMKKKGEWIRQAYRVLQAFPFIQGALYYVEVCPSGQQNERGPTRFIHALDLRSVSRGAGPKELLKRDRSSFSPLQGLFVEKGILYQVFGKLDGNLMADHLYRSVPLSLAESVHILKAVSGHLVRMYERGEFTIIHPQNMILTNDTVRFLYGGPIGMLPKRGGGKQPPTPAGERQKEEGLDAYSLGALAYIMLTGASPVPGSVTPIKSYRKDVPSRLEQFVIKSLTADPESRPRVVDIWEWLTTLPPKNTEFEKKKDDPVYWLKQDKESVEKYLFQFPEMGSPVAVDSFDVIGWDGWEVGEVEAGPWVKRTTVTPDFERLSPKVEESTPTPTLESVTEPAHTPKSEVEKEPRKEAEVERFQAEYRKEDQQPKRKLLPESMNNHPMKAWLTERPMVAVATIVALLGVGIGTYFLSGGQSSAKEEAARNYGEAVKSYKEHQINQALSYAKKAVIADPKEEQYLLYLANLYGEKKQYEQSINVLQKGVKAAPKARVYDSLGVYLLLEGEEESAREAIDKALKLEPDNPLFLYHQGRVYGARENYDAAAQALKKAVKLQKDSSRYHGMLSYYLLHSGDAQGAREHALKATELEPNNSTHWVGLGRAYLVEREQEIQGGNFGKKRTTQLTNKAVIALRKAASLDPKNSKAFYYLSISLYFYGSLAQAEDNAKKAVDISQNTASYQYQYGVVLQKNSKKEKAKQAYEKALKIDPRDSRYQKALKQIGKAKKYE
ncbi:Flp pilus assembly protein TadD, contains TPR repeats [Marininema mesophilum]|uniref:Flp pilus assembly protein TadD, contains TPR repeats n=1 Tax=Marininema mesophilum TaxID=1048340 RepID=A0A1H2X5R5_9BACL|nr:tetratricopeptide repeat protein [Marininema mesophilum]SDW88232.1 Flp pilus assembly protein TadD, contains TPR repeats [Marininema mesophilum]